MGWGRLRATMVTMHKRRRHNHILTSWCHLLLNNQSICIAPVCVLLTKKGSWYSKLRVSIVTQYLDTMQHLRTVVHTIGMSVPRMQLHSSHLMSLNSALSRAFLSSKPATSLANEALVSRSTDNSLSSPAAVVEVSSSPSPSPYRSVSEYSLCWPVSHYNILLNRPVTLPILGSETKMCLFEG